MTGAARLEFGWRHDEAKPLCTTAKPAIDGDQAAIVQLRKRDVLGVVGLRPAEILGDFPRSHRQPVRPLLADRKLPGEKPLHGQLGEGVGDIAPKGHLVKHRGNLAPQQRRRDELASAIEGSACLLSGPVERQLDRQARVYDQHAQCDSRERRTAAATFGIGSPVRVSPQPAGNAAISGSSTDSSGMTIRARAALASSRSSTSRSSFSFAVTLQAYRPTPRKSEERNR
jgi:hypothetical protein